MTERVIARLIYALTVACLAAGCANQQVSVDLVIENVSVYDGLGAGPVLANVAIRDGRIQAVDVDRGDTYAALESINGEGLFMTPGLWDTHVHLRSTVDGGLHLESFIRHGVTSVRDLGGYSERIEAAMRAVSEGDEVGPTIYSAYSMLNGEQFADFQRVVTTAAEAAEAIAELAGNEADQVKVHRALSPTLLPAVVELSSEYGLGVTGHIPLGLHPRAACDAGMSGIEHVGSLVEAVASSEPPVNSADAILYLLSERAASLYECLAANEVHVTPTLVIYPAIAQHRTGGGPLTEAFQEFITSMQRITAALDDAGVRLTAGTDVSDLTEAFTLEPGAALLDELDMLQQAGIAPADIIRIATFNAAEALGVEDRAGSIAPGKDADFLLLSRDPGADARNFAALEAVYVSGRELYRNQGP